MPAVDNHWAPHGKPTTHPLVYGVDGDRYAIVASKGGANTNPPCYFNLLAKPQLQVQVGPELFTATASLSTGNERLRVWSFMTTVCPPPFDYQAKTWREIPIFTLRKQCSD